MLVKYRVKVRYLALRNQVISLCLTSLCMYLAAAKVREQNASKHMLWKEN